MKTKFFRKHYCRQFKLTAIGKLTAYCHCLLLLFLWPMVLVAQNGVSLSGLVVDAGTVTFNVSWKSTGMPAIWSDTVWVWVDYNDAGTMTRLPLSPGATLTTHTAPDDVGKVIEVSGNDKGVWVVGYARSAGSFSATVRLLTATSAAAAACVYASNYPPVGQYTSVTNITFRGTRPYDVVLQPASGSSTVTRVAGGSLTIPPDYTLASFTDKTGAPGTLTCALPSATYTLMASNICMGSGATFTLSGSQSGWNYQLYKGGAAVGGIVAGTGGTLTFNDTPPAAGGFNYTVWSVGVTGAQCEVQVSDDRTLTVYDLPVVASVSASTLCAGGTATLTATVSGSTTTAMTYTWNIGDTESITDVNTKTTQPLSANTAFTVTVKNSIGCTSAQKNGTITVTSPAASGKPANACGCATSLINCSGNCISVDCCNNNCTTWTTCPSIAMITPSATLGRTSFETAEGLCNSLGAGWRLPDLVDMACMQANRDSLPGGSATDEAYWTSWSGDGGASHYVCRLDAGNCGTSFTNRMYNVKCVK